MRTVPARNGPGGSPPLPSLSSSLPTAVFPKKRKGTPYLYEANPGGIASLPSTTLARGGDFRKGLPLLSVAADEADLYDEGWGIIANPLRTSRNWERLATFSYFDGGRLLAASSAGVRMHAGHRYRGGPIRGLRLYFRSIYGARELRTGQILAEAEGPVRTLVVRGGQAFTTAVAFDIARRIGARAPEAKPAMFYLNGDYQGVYTLSKHLSRRQLAHELGHENFYLVKYRGTSFPTASRMYQSFRERMMDESRRLTMEDVSAEVDVGNLSRHLLSFIFCGTTDWRQGAAVLDLSARAPQWQWINWDMDHSFVDLAQNHLRQRRQPWEQETFELITSGRKLWRNEPVEEPDVRAVIFRRLLEEDPSYRSYFFRLVVDTLNHRLTKDVLRPMMSRYGELVRRSGEEVYISRMREIVAFLENRGDFLLSRLHSLAGSQAIHTVEVSGPPGTEYSIDGFSEKAGFRGRYLEGQEVSIEVAGAARNRLSHWLVNGQRRRGPRLVLPVETDLILEPSFLQGFSAYDADDSRRETARREDL